MRVLVLNGWAAHERAWDLCEFVKDPGARMVSYVEQMDGVAEKELDDMGSAVVVGWSMGGSRALAAALSDGRHDASEEDQGARSRRSDCAHDGGSELERHERSSA